MVERIISSQGYDVLQRQGFCVSVADKPTSRMHGHEFLEFSYIESGKMEHTFGGEAQLLRQGDYFIVDYGTHHQYKAVGETPLRVINFLFYPSFVDRMLGERDSFEKVVNSYLIRFRYRSLQHSPSGIVFHDQDGAVITIVRRIMEEFQCAQAGYLEYIRCLLVEMLIHIMRNISTTESPTQQGQVVSAITKYIRENYMQRLRLSDFAASYSYSLSHLSKKFTEETGNTFMQYLQRVRIEQACKFLQEQELSVSEIAEAVGYADIKFFNKVFKEMLGLTPREFRKLNKE